MKLFHSLRQLPFKGGDFLREARMITCRDLDAFSNITGDHNPIHKKSPDNQKPIVHGAFLNSIVAGLIGTRLPGPGTIVLSQNFSFPTKCFADEPIEIHIELLDVRKIIKVSYECKQSGSVVFQGEAKLMIKLNEIDTG